MRLNPKSETQNEIKLFYTYVTNLGLPTYLHRPTFLTYLHTYHILTSY